MVLTLLTAFGYEIPRENEGLTVQQKQEEESTFIFQRSYCYFPRVAKILSIGISKYTIRPVLFLSSLYPCEVFILFFSLS